MGLSIVMGIPSNGWLTMENPIEIDENWIYYMYLYVLSTIWQQLIYYVFEFLYDQSTFDLVAVDSQVMHEISFMISPEEDLP